MAVGGRGLILSSDAIYITAAGAAHSVAYTNFIARTSGLNQTHLDAYAALLDGLTNDGIFNSDGTSSFLDIFYILATADQTTALLNLVSSSYGGTTHGTVSFTADQGYTGDGSSFYIDTGWKPTDGPNYVQSAASAGYYSLTDFAASPGRAPIGQDALTNYDLLLVTTNTTHQSFSINSLNPFASGSVSTTTKGQFILSRTSSSQCDAYKNGNTTAIASFTDTSGALSAANVFLLATDTGAPAGLFWEGVMSAAFTGGALSSANMALLAARINTYMTTFGINVY